MSSENGSSSTPRATHCYHAHPLRVQRKRTAGYKMPDDVVYVGRPTKWGNPYKASDCVDGVVGAVQCFIILVESEPETIAEIQRELRGKRLSCWCPLDKPCHADILAEIANRS